MNQSEFRMVSQQQLYIKTPCCGLLCCHKNKFYQLLHKLIKYLFLIFLQVINVHIIDLSYLPQMWVIRFYGLFRELHTYGAIVGTLLLPPWKTIKPFAIVYLLLFHLYKYNNFYLILFRFSFDHCKNFINVPLLHGTPPICFSSFSFSRMLLLKS